MDELTNQSEGTQETQETSQQETQVENTTQQTQQETPQTFKVKYNHQEIEIPYEEAATHIQKGMNYEKAVERAKQESIQAGRDTWIAEQKWEWQGKPITTEAEYKQALQEKAIYDRYKDQGLPEDVIDKLAKVDQIEKKLTEGERAQQENERKSREYEDFFSYFKEVNGREFNSATDQLPNEVFVIAEKNKIPLRFAYAQHLANEFRTKLTGIEQGQQTAEINASNASTSPGSVNGNGQPAGAITQADVDAHAHDTAWMMKHYDQVEKLLSPKKG